jgi:ribonuclease J
MWRGYLSDPYHSEALEWCRAAGAEIAYIHTSGHASPADLRAFAAAVRPRTVVPVHGLKWDEESHGFGTVRRLRDAEAMVIPRRSCSHIDSAAINVKRPMSRLR